MPPIPVPNFPVRPAPIRPVRPISPSQVQKPLPPPPGYNSRPYLSPKNPMPERIPNPKPNPIDELPFGRSPIPPLWDPSSYLPPPAKPFNSPHNPFTNPGEWYKDYSDWVRDGGLSGRPPKPVGRSPSTGSSTGNPPINPGNGFDGEVDLPFIAGKWYTVKTQYSHRSITETVWVNNSPKFRHLRWGLEYSGEQQLRAPFKLRWKFAERAVVDNYLNPPSEYQWIQLVHESGVYDLIGNGSSYFAEGSWAVRPVETPTADNPWIPGNPPSYYFPPANESPTIPQDPPWTLRNRNSELGDPTIIPRFPGFKEPIRMPPGGEPGIVPFRPKPPIEYPKNPPKRVPETPKSPDKGNPDGPAMPPETPSETPSFPPNIKPEIPGNLPNPPIARDPCLPKGSYEKMTCRYQPTDGQKIDEILKRIGKPKNADGLTGIIGDDKPRHPLTQMPTNLTSLVRGNWWLNALNAVFAPLNFVANIHNAFMLSADIKETVGSFMSITLDVVRTTLSLKDPDDAMIDINDVVNKNFESMMDNLLGASNWELIKQRAAAVNRIYMAQTNAMYAIKNSFDSVFEAMGTIGQYTGKIGNALKKAQVVYEDAYDWMDEERSSEMARMGRFGNLTGRLEGVEDAANMLLAIASSVKEVQEGAKELADSLTEYERAKAEAIGKWSDDYEKKVKNQKETQAPDSIAEVELKTFDFEDN